MKDWNLKFVLLVKGALMGVANVIPGVSGGTVAFVTGIYEELIQSIKACDHRALQLLLRGRFRDFFIQIHFAFLAPVFFGAGISVISLAKVLEFVYTRYEVQTVSFFFGLILASIPLVARQIQRWNASTGFFLVLGTCLAAGIAFLKPMQENGNSVYLVLCGMIAISSMILPGISGSYVLLIMGNYLLVLRAVGNLDLPVLLPFAIGCAVGVVAFSHLLAYVFRKFPDATVSLLTGFVAGSLVVIWPWKEIVYLRDESGGWVLKSDGSRVASGYDWQWPEMNGAFAVALCCLIGAAVLVWALGRLDPKSNGGEVVRRCREEKD